MNINTEYWKDKRVLVTGASGFAGSWAAEILMPLGSKVYGLVRRQSAPSLENIEHLSDKIKLVEGNLLDQNSIKEILDKHEIEVIFHLAAQSFVPSSFTAPTDTYLTNVIGTVNVLEAARMYDKLEKMQFAGSSEEYGLVYPQETPIKETNPLRPMSPYAVSKIAGDFACYNHNKTYGIPVVRTRGFNHTGPRRGNTFVTCVIATQAAQIKLGQRKEFELGNLEAKRDFTHVKDMINGYMLAIEKGENGEVYNLCSEKAFSVNQVVELASKAAGIKAPVRQDPQRMRPSEVPLLLGDCSKARKAFGFKAEIPFEQTINEMVEWQLKKLQAK